MMKIYEAPGITNLFDRNNGNNNGYLIFNNAQLYNDMVLQDHIDQIKDYCLEEININGVITPILKGSHINNQKILTEGDLQGYIHALLLYGINNNQVNNNPKIHTELSDKISMNDNYCIGLINDGEIGHYTRRTDITYNFSGVYGDESEIEKGFALNGLHIDIEIKYLKRRYETRLLKSIQKDLCKLKSLLHPEIDQNNINHPNTAPLPINTHGCVVFGIMIIAFQSEALLDRYLNNGLEQSLIEFNQLNNVDTLLLYEA